MLHLPVAYGLVSHLRTKKGIWTQDTKARNDWVGTAA